MRVHVCDPGELEWEAKALKTKEYITTWMSESMERITRESRDRTGWRRLVRCVTRAADYHS